MDHAEQYAAQTGKDIEDVLLLFDLTPPEIPDGGEMLWAWFWELASGRGSNGFGPQSLAWGDMTAWAGICGISLQPWHATILRAMDGAWLTARAEKKQGE